MHKTSFLACFFFTPCQTVNRKNSFRDDPKSSRQSVLSFAPLLEQVPLEDI